MPYLSQHGVYFIEYDSYDKRWTVEPMKADPDFPLDKVNIRELAEGNIYFIFLYALNPISAFTRAANAIIDKIEGKI
jgi:hypothetical protein